jgi:hypothetical protein
LRKGAESIGTIKSVVKKGCNGVYSQGRGAVEVWLGDWRVIQGEVGGRGVGDEDGLSGEESGEAGAGVQELEVGEREALRDDVVGYDEGVHVGRAVEGVLLRDEEGGAHWES